MRNIIVSIMVVAAAAYWVYLHGKSRTDNRDRGAVTTETANAPTSARRLLEDRTYGSYGECDEAAERMVKDLKDQGISVALASRSTLTKSTVYKVYYRDATGQVSCRGERLISDIVEER
jgi:hypothetical protein